ncbi:hypothetical protein [Pelagibius marinus]|uniref:hypothetical protein n=1 Tax=Pelagibius marinus TaxID=2762760 RepID=UPI00187307B2|nr:hypothetical protein [Pelagibius marinus]
MTAGMFLAGTAQAANSWGLPNEETARFEAKVVDVLCELKDDCPTDGGAGRRQLGLLLDDGTLVLPVKNSTPFSGTQVELLPFLGKKVVADGLFMTNHGVRLFALQFVREAPDGEWRGANRFLKAWAENNGYTADAKETKQWFRHDPRVKALIGEQGKLGLGPEADKAFLEE